MREKRHHIELQKYVLRENVFVQKFDLQMALAAYVTHWLMMSIRNKLTPAAATAPTRLF